MPSAGSFMKTLYHKPYFGTMFNGAADVPITLSGLYERLQVSTPCSGMSMVLWVSYDGQAAARLIGSSWDINGGEGLPLALHCLAVASVKGVTHLSAAVDP